MGGGEASTHGDSAVWVVPEGDGDEHRVGDDMGSTEGTSGQPKKEWNSGEAKIIGKEESGRRRQLGDREREEER